ncbi:hypothetical protein ACT6NV_12185 [Robiginitalea sp. IMCC44478]|uniref:hypothetical protein n=1 Tax=Robiginitalea sp. IMCC44478 TaxID=3459122 RepID=UPI004042B6A6
MNKFIPSGILVLFNFLLFTSLITAQQAGPNPLELDQLFEADIYEDLQQNELDSLITWQEHILVHLDKPVCNPGDPLFFKAYTLTGPNRVRATLSKVLKMELLNSDNQIVSTQYHKIEDGMASGTFEVPRKLKEGKYTLRAYTRWLENYGAEFYFNTSILLGDSGTNLPKESESSAITVEFYPEGGNLVSGFENRLFLKVNSAHGGAADFSGEIVSETGKVIPVSNFRNGILSTIFTPEVSDAYTLRTTDGSSFSLPEIKEAGFLLQANNLDPKILRVRVLGNMKGAKESLRVKGIMNGITYFEQELQSEGQRNELDISKESFPTGTLQIVLVNGQNEVLASRPALIENPRQLNVSIVPLTKTNENRNSTFKISVRDATGKPVQTGLSLSATNYSETSDGTVFHAGTSFNQEIDFLQISNMTPDRRGRFIRDLELLTSEWKNSKHISADQQIRYPFQKGLDLFGYAYDLNNKLLKNTKIQMLTTQSDEIILREFETDGSGLLKIEGLDLSGETELIFRTEGESTQTRLVKVRPIQRQYDQNATTQRVVIKNDQKTNAITESSPFVGADDDKLVNLEEVEVRDKKMNRKRPIEPQYGLEASGKRSVVQNIERPKFIWQLLSELPGVVVSGNPAAPRVSLVSTGSGTSARRDTNFMTGALDDPGPLWVIDGFIVGKSPIFDPTWGLTFWDIDRIEKLLPAEASMYGSRATEGVFMIYTRNGSEFEFTNRKDGRLLFQGYHQSEGFGSYTQELNKKPRRYEGRPATLFWNPDLQTDANGEAIVEIESPIAVGQLEIKVSTVTETGAIGSARMVYKP